MLDDIGAEEVTPWVRDEVIGPLLHYRMVHELPTFFSSNFDYSELEHHLAMTRDGEEKTKQHVLLNVSNLCQHHTFIRRKFQKQLNFKMIGV